MHSNVSGVLGGALGDKTLNETEILEAAETEDAQTDEPLSMEDLIIAEAKSRGRQPNISFYAFTATPHSHDNGGFLLADAVLRALLRDE